MDISRSRVLIKRMGAVVKQRADKHSIFHAYFWPETKSRSDAPLGKTSRCALRIGEITPHNKGDFFKPVAFKSK